VHVSVVSLAGCIRGSMEVSGTSQKSEKMSRKDEMGLGFRAQS
jgi:hypothetical protein